MSDWKTINSEIKYENPWIRVEEHQVINPAGKKGIYGKICAKCRAVGIIPLDQFGNTWIVGQQRYTLNEYSWEIPMGGGPLDEEPLTAAQRELKEETGLTASEWEQIMHLHTANSVSDEEGYVYVAKGLTEGKTAFEETEDITIKKAPFSEVLRMVLDGEITDAISAAAILKVSHLDLVGKNIAVIYRDEQYVVVYKPAGLLVHRTSSASDRDFLLQRVRNQIGEKVYPVHRLDRATSGLVIFALTSEAAEKICRLFSEAKINKQYIALVRGFTDEKGCIDSPLKSGKNKHVIQQAETEYALLEKVELPIPAGPYETARYSLVKINTKTGRFHQIRRHFSRIGHPVIGDTRHGDGEHNRLLRQHFRSSRLMLMANELEFEHPYTGKKVVVKVRLDEDFRGTLDKLGFNGCLHKFG